MTITSNMTVTPDSSDAHQWFLTMTYAGQTSLSLNIQYTKGSENHWTHEVEVQEAGNWYTLSQKNIEWIKESNSFFLSLILPDTADDFRVIIKEYIDPDEDLSATGSINIQAQLS